MKNAVLQVTEPRQEAETRDVAVRPRVTPRNLFPGYFAYAMATGILATTSFRLGMGGVAWVFLVLAAIGYVLLMVANGWRAAAFGQEMAKDFTDFGRGPGFFTAIAATNVLANAFLIVANRPAIAWALYIFSWVLWIGMIYGFGLSMITNRSKPGLEQGINGSWLIMVVATQTISIAGSNLASTSSDPSSMLLLSAGMFVLGAALYLLLISLILYRLVFFVLKPETFTPTYWVCMGAAAITTLAGGELDKRAALWSAHLQAQPALQGFTFFFWVIATFWVPLLLLLGCWRHLVRKVPFVYDPQYWSLVFPLGMYTLCTFTLGSHFELPLLKSIPPISIWIAILAWSLSAYGLLGSVIRAWTRPVQESA